MAADVPGFTGKLSSSDSFTLSLASTKLTIPKVIFYNNVNGCNAKDDTKYRILTSRGDGTCYTFDKDMHGVTCQQYTRGGIEGPVGCSGPLPRQSIHDLPDEGGSCAFYSDDNCKADRVSSGCIDASAIPSKKIGSFQCFVSISHRKIWYFSSMLILGIQAPPARDDCKIAVSRFSRQNAASYLATVEHSITVRTCKPPVANKGYP